MNCTKTIIAASSFKLCYIYYGQVKIAGCLLYSNQFLAVPTE